MEIMIILSLLLYMLSAAGYMAYLFAQKAPLHRVAYGLLLAGFVCHSAAIGYGFVSSGRIPVQNLHETLSFAGWAVAGVFLIVQYRYKLRILGIFAAPLVAFVMVVASQLPRQPAVSQELFNNFWLISHIVTIFAGEAAFALACGAGILYLLQENAIKSKSRGFFFKRLPSLEQLDSVGYGCIIGGFTLMTIGLIAGFAYAKSVWGHFWSWDPKEVWSGITWLFYAALLHERLTVGWRGRKAAVMAIIGFGVLLFTFLGVNFFLKGHHGGFTQM